MKTGGFYITVLVCALLLFPALSAGQVVKVTGRVAEKGNDAAVGFATIVAMRSDSTVAAATVAAEDGAYSMEIPSSEYIFNVSCIGYEIYGQAARCYGKGMQLDFSLDPSATTIDEVRVKAPKIVRESDRFVMNVAGTLDAVGKNAEELLRNAPAVRIKDDKIRVDGR
ncbi:MAG: hypothetical protein LUE10_04340, partial [Alistipes sp.]|nr:hypothetical protein [Alistipes sp.]